MASRESEWKSQRAHQNDFVLERKHQGLMRFFNLDSAAYRPGVIDSRTKEMMGLVASLVLRCDDCITYHLIRCVEEGTSDAEFDEILNIGLVVGGSIVIPHLRRAYQTLKELREGDQS